MLHAQKPIVTLRINTNTKQIEDPKALDQETSSYQQEHLQAI